MCRPNLVAFLNQTPVFVWSGVDLRTDTKKSCALQEIGLDVQNLFTILGSIVNLIEGTYMTIDDLEDLHFDNESYLFM